MDIRFLDTIDVQTKAFIVPVLQEEEGYTISGLDKDLQTFVKDIAGNNENFTAKFGEIMHIALSSSFDQRHVILLGLGAAAELNQSKSEELGAKAYVALKALKLEHVSLLVDQDLKLDISQEKIAAYLACGFKMRSYDFNHYKSKKADDNEKTIELEALDVILSGDEEAENIFDELDSSIAGVFLARDFVNEPPNALYPDSYALRIRDELKPLGVDVEILDEKKMQKLGMGAILAVGMGSSRKPRMVIMRWNGDSQSADRPVALVGKGVTFDTGGISLKPGAGMEDMKMDMGGSAAVVGTMKTLALRKAKANVVGIVGLAENMPSSTAYRPADVLTSYSGKTIEVLNTDAEGRLVLADCLSYVQEKYEPHTVIDLATLTGAMMVALGFEYCGAFVNDDALWSNIEGAGKSSAEKIWRMPLDKAWYKEVESTIADVQNLGNAGRWAGACTAAEFLHHFINEDVAWAHLDIAGTAWSKKDKPLGPKHGTGYGVRLLNALIAENYESQ